MTVLDELVRTIDRMPGSRGDFAKAVGIKQPYLSDILRGRRPLSRLPAGTLLKFSQVSGIALDRLAGAAATSPPLAPGLRAAE